MQKKLIRIVKNYLKLLKWFQMGIGLPSKSPVSATIVVNCLTESREDIKLGMTEAGAKLKWDLTNCLYYPFVADCSLLLSQTMSLELILILRQLAHRLEESETTNLLQLYPNWLRVLWICVSLKIWLRTGKLLAFHQL